MGLIDYLFGKKKGKSEECQDFIYVCCIKKEVYFYGFVMTWTTYDAWTQCQCSNRTVRLNNDKLHYEVIDEGKPVWIEEGFIKFPKAP